MDFETWWEQHRQFCRAGGGYYEKTFAFRAWEAAHEECAKICELLGGDIDKSNPDDVKLAANSLADTIRKRSNVELRGCALLRSPA